MRVIRKILRFERNFFFSLKIKLNRFIYQLMGIHIGRNLTNIDRCKVSVPHNLYIGDDVLLMNGVNFVLDNSIYIGSHVIIGFDVSIISSNHNYTNTEIPMISQGMDTSKKPVFIKDDVWIGAKSIILDEITIEKGAIIGAGAVVTHDIPPYAIAVGNPARVIAYRNKMAF